jgi:hypothetical protein
MSFSLSDCFGCFGLRQKQYCILNKAYAKEEYGFLKAKIIEHMKKTGEWGNYFPEKFSPFGYNESVAQIYFPLTKEEALKKGYTWYDRKEERNYKPTMETGAIPQRIADTPDSITEEVIQCVSQLTEEGKRLHEECTTAFRMTPLELGLYRKLGVPIPSKCFPCRRTDRFALRNPRKLWHRKCNCAGKTSVNTTYINRGSHFHGEARCPNEFDTSYAPDRKEIVYCETCYQQETV